MKLIAWHIGINRRGYCGCGGLEKLRIRSTAKSIAPCIRPKICVVGCEVRSGVASKSLLKVRLRCKACHALPCEDRQPPQNQLQFAECTCRKSCVVRCDVLRGVASKSPLKIRLRCKACHASNSASAAPQNQLHLRNCTCRKSCMVGCDVACGVGG